MFYPYQVISYRKWVFLDLLNHLIESISLLPYSLSIVLDLLLSANSVVGYRIPVVMSLV